MNGATLLLAAATLSPAPHRTSEGMKSGPWGLAMILLLCIAVYFLWRSMNRHLRKVRERTDATGRWSMSFDAREAGSAPADAKGLAETMRSQAPGPGVAGSDVAGADSARSDLAPPDGQESEPGQASAATGARAVEHRDQAD